MFFMKEDKVWFFASARFQANKNYIAGVFNNLNAGNPNAWTFVPDTANQGIFHMTQESVTTRVTWQANTVIELHQLPVLGELDTFEALDLWAELNIASQKRFGFANGCGEGWSIVHGARSRRVRRHRHSTADGRNDQVNDDRRRASEQSHDHKPAENGTEIPVHQAERAGDRAGAPIEDRERYDEAGGDTQI